MSAFVHYTTHKSDHCRTVFRAGFVLCAIPFMNPLGLIVTSVGAVQRQGIVTELTDPVKVNVPASGQLI